MQENNLEGKQSPLVGNKVLNLTLKKKWFDMIASGEKKEEYREIKPYWVQRLTWHEYHKCDYYQLLHYEIESDVYRHDFDFVCFHNGYNKDSASITLPFIETCISYGKEEWGAKKCKLYFVIKLGKLLTNK